MYRMYVCSKQADNPQLQREASQQDFSLRRLRRCRRRKWNENPLKSFSNFTSLSVCLSLSVHMPEEPVWGRDLSWDRTRSRCCCCCCCWTHKNVVASTCFVLSRILFLLSQALLHLSFLSSSVCCCCLPVRNWWSNWLHWISCLGTRADSATRPRCHRLHSPADDSSPEFWDHSNRRPRRIRTHTHVFITWVF